MARKPLSLVIDGASGRLDGNRIIGSLDATRAATALSFETDMCRKREVPGPGNPSVP